LRRETSSFERLGRAGPAGDALFLALLALAVRLLVAAYAASRFPPAFDGTYYDALARRIAAGAGYTWLWPDGTVTHVAHYPVGYPALLGLFYSLLGATQLVALLLNVVFGVGLVLGAHALALRVSTRRGALVAGLVLALQPTLLLYTAALMTEALSASLVLMLSAGALLARARDVSRARDWACFTLLGVGGTVLILVRPQLAPLVPLFGWIASRGAARLPARVVGAIATSSVALALCLPWTLRNCQKLPGCALVSANAGWNLLIGTLPHAGGGFAAIAGESVPRECHAVFAEVEKDRCFRRAALSRIASDPAGWFSLVPAKLGRLFDYSSIGAPYLRASNGELVSRRTEWVLGATEIVTWRLLLVFAALGLARTARGRVERGLLALACLFAVLPWAVVGHVSLGAALSARLLRGQVAAGERAVLSLSLAVLGLTLATHAVFFGAARYALPYLAWLPILAVLGGRTGDGVGKQAADSDAESLTGAGRGEDNSRPTGALECR
jgi:4-amino-4-deoxy-L-arabinose transferase-like glycosyltransferase